MIITAGHAQVNHYFTGAGMPRGAQVTYGVPLIGAPTPTQVLTEVTTIFQTRWQSAIPISVSLSKTRVKFGPNDTGVFVEGGATFTGTYNTPADAPQVAVLIRKGTAFGGRKGTGRMFMPITPEVDTQNGGTIDPTALAALQSRASTWLTNLQAGSYAGGMVLFHNDEATTPYTVSSLSVQGLLATQRRRIRKVGGRRKVTTSSP